MLNTRMREAECLIRMFRMASRPLAPGIDMSMTTMSGAWVFERAVSGGGVVGLGDHAKIALVFQDAPIALPDDGMVVDQQDRNALGLGSGHPDITRRAESWRPR
jgi:hypothetical protein